MIAKILPSKSLNNVLDYHFEKIANGQAKILDPHLHDKDKQYVFNFINEATVQRSHQAIGRSKSRPLKNEPLFHASLSLNENEHLDDDKFKSLCDDYVKAMGYFNNDYTVIRHADTNHEHAHVIVNKIERGKFNVVDRGFDRLNSLKISRRLEKKYNLIPLPNEKYNKTLNTEKDRVFGKIKQIKDLIDKAKANSYSYNNLKYELLKGGIIIKEGNKNGKPIFGYKVCLGKDFYFNSSSLCKHYNKAGLDNSFVYADEKDKVKETVKGILKQYSTIQSMFDFELLLLREGIRLKTSRYRDGNIFGLSLNYNGNDYKGSDIGLSWKNIEDQFVDKRENPNVNFVSDKDILYKILSGQSSRVKCDITRTEFESLPDKLKANYLNNYISNTKILTFDRFIDEARKFSGIEYIGNNMGALINLSFSGLSMNDNLKINLEGLCEKLNANTAKEMEVICKYTQTFEDLRYKIVSAFGDEAKMKGNIVEVDGESFNILDLGFKDHSREIKGGGVNIDIFRTDRDNWDNSEAITEEERKRRLGFGRGL